MAPDTSGSLERLDVLVGEWETNVPGVEAEGRTTFEWLEGGGFLIERSTVDRPEFPNGICVIGATGTDGGLQQHYFDSRGIARVYEMTLEDGVWTLSRGARLATALRRRTERGRQHDHGPLAAGHRARCAPGARLRPDVYARALTRAWAAIMPRAP
jgi:hypothetical protein